MTYPLQFRQKVFATKEKFKLTFEQTSERFDIPIRTLFRWQRKMEPRITRDKPATKLDMDKLAQDVELAPDDYQWERAKRLEVAERTIGYGLKRLGISYKKNAQASQGKRRRTYSFSEKPMNQKAGLLCIWMKVALLKICRVHTVIPAEGSVAMVSMIGSSGGVSMQLEPLSDLFF